MNSKKSLGFVAFLYNIGIKYLYKYRHIKQKIFLNVSILDLALLF